MSSPAKSETDAVPRLERGQVPHEVQLNQTTLWQNRKAVFFATVIGSASFQYGMDFMMIGGFQAMPGWLKIFGYPDEHSTVGYNIKTEVQQLISSLMVLGAFIGSLLAGPIARFCNRRQSIGIAIVLCVISLGIQMGTTSLGVLYFARLLIGIGNGFFMTFVQLYIQEISPPHLRGVLFTFFQFFVSFGAFIAAIIGNKVGLLPGKECYQIPLGVLFIVPGILTIVLPFTPDSPRWYAGRNEDEKGLRALQRIRGSSVPEHLVLAEYAEIQSNVRMEHDLNAARPSFMSLFKREDGSLRRTCLSVGAVCLQAASGAMFLLSYGGYFFEIAGMGGKETFRNGLITAAIGLFGVMVTSFFVRFMGRRTLLMSASTIQGLCMLIMAVIYTVSPDSESARKTLVGFLCIYTAWYGGWTGPIAWVVGGEIPSQKQRSHTLGLAAAAGFLGGWLASFTAPYFINSEDLDWGPKYGYIWFGSNAIALVWIWWFLPETKDRTLEEIEEMFAAKVPARKFAKYVCVGSITAREAAVIGEVKDEKATGEHVDSLSSPSISEKSL